MLRLKRMSMEMRRLISLAAITVAVGQVSADIDAATIR